MELSGSRPAAAYFVTGPEVVETTAGAAPTSGLKELKMQRMRNVPAALAILAGMVAAPAFAQAPPSLWPGHGPNLATCPGCRRDYLPSQTVGSRVLLSEDGNSLGLDVPALYDDSRRLARETRLGKFQRHNLGLARQEPKIVVAVEDR